ncbi:MAG: hypothetical protein COA52_03330 [Hyphomicrobiales bacterium]|nr:MAG: hypothetical protein COA52_03330 [Hyphomicrobiales bacterium]
MPRITSELWVDVYLRQCRSSGAFTYLAMRGSSAAGAIYIKIIGAGGATDLYGPAPQSLVPEDAFEGSGRSFELLVKDDAGAAETKLQSQKNFDPDFWLIEVEDNKGHHRLDLIVA